MNTINLNGEWKLTGGNINCKVNIPGDFHSALISEKIIPDPFYGFNEKDVQWVGKTDWTIEREFDFTVEEKSETYLELNEADTFFTVFINNKKCASGNNAFLRHRFNVTKFLQNGKNTISILFESAEKKSIEYSKKLPYKIPYMKYDVYSPARNMARKCQCNGGWDWGPCIMVSGIYGGISLKTVSTGLFNSVHVEYSHKENDWIADVSVSFDSIKNTKKTFVFSIAGNDIETSHVSKNISLQKGKNTIQAKLKVSNPSVWMTAGELKESGLSENTLYDLKIKIEDEESCQLTQKIAFNTLKVISKKDKAYGKDGRSLYFENNGRKIFAKGSNWIPTDSLPSRLTFKRYEDLLKSAVAANQNCIRVWGGGYYEKDFFYDLCDKLGLIVWQDCMFACSLYPVTEDFLENVKSEIEYQVGRLQPHACIGIWCGNNENFGALNWFPESNQNRDRYLVDYDRLYVDTIGKKIKELDPSRIYWPSSPCSGPDDFADNWHADSMGDMHYWSVWHERKSFDAYLSINPRFVSEFGYESFPSLETIRSFAQEKDFNFTSKLMEYHQRSPSGNSIMLENFSRYFCFPNGFENMIYLSQVQQALAIKTAVDWWRSLKPHCMGALVWQLNDIWPGPSWSSLEYNGKWKLLHYEERKFFDIVYQPLYIKDNKLYAFFSNDTQEKLSVNLKISYLKFDGSNFKQEIILKKNVSPDTTIYLFEEEIDTENKNNYFIYAEYQAVSEKGKSYQGCNTVFPGLFKHAEIENPEIDISFIEQNDYFEIKLKSQKPAFFVSLDNDDLPGIFDDNMFTLLSGQTKIIKFVPAKKTDLKTVIKKVSLKHLKSTF